MQKITSELEAVEQATKMARWDGEVFHFEGWSGDMAEISKCFSDHALVFVWRLDIPLELHGAWISAYCAAATRTVEKFRSKAA